MFRVELRRREAFLESHKEAELRRQGLRAQGGSRQSQVRQTAFMMGRLNDEMLLVLSPDRYQVRLGALTPQGIEALIEQDSRSLEAGPSSSLRTRVILPLGAWMPVGGSYGQSTQSSREILGAGASAQSRDFGLEIRVSPSGPR
jgi:hypothetical protein